MNACPICDIEQPTRSKLLSHAWQHLSLDTEASITGAKRTTSQNRFCWCGLPVYAFVFWHVHMEGKDVQAHYAASLLGINR